MYSYKAPPPHTAPREPVMAAHSLWWLKAEDTFKPFSFLYSHHLLPCRW
uniref:Uncharacterized protein n=1 Tax=Denticeps clupeoides TaxID=299321 RepID=A0AAY4CUW1_9TELE